MSRAFRVIRFVSYGFGNIRGLNTKNKYTLGNFCSKRGVMIWVVGSKKNQAMYRTVLYVVSVLVPVRPRCVPVPFARLRKVVLDQTVVSTIPFAGIIRTVCPGLYRSRSAANPYEQEGACGALPFLAL